MTWGLSSRTIRTRSPSTSSRGPITKRLGKSLRVAEVGETGEPQPSPVVLSGPAKLECAQHAQPIEGVVGDQVRPRLPACDRGDRHVGAESPAQVGERGGVLVVGSARSRGARGPGFAKRRRFWRSPAAPRVDVELLGGRRDARGQGDESRGETTEFYQRHAHVSRSVSARTPTPKHTP